MPTTRPRHMVTETDEIAAALDVAAQAWPEESRARLLRRLIAEGKRAVEERHESAYERRLADILATSGGFEDCFEPGDRERLRDEWPA
ncbi:MAG: hypothetical protein M9891_09430 [Austwickia sp.]|nr:hypothetical protein [Austwickia sp.]MCO5309497.1 hypothetical protein [Austwickia sp.]